MIGLTELTNKIDMNKIMFNDKYSLTQAVLEGLKTMTRRIFYIPDKLVPTLILTIYLILSMIVLFGKTSLIIFV